MPLSLCGSLCSIGNTSDNKIGLWLFNAACDNNQCMSAKTKSIIGVSVLGLVDIIIPVPILGAILMYVILQRPRWFRDTVREIYGER